MIKMKNSVEKILSSDLYFNWTFLGLVIQHIWIKGEVGAVKPV